MSRTGFCLRLICLDFDSECADWVCPVITTVILVAACVIVCALLYKFNPTLTKSSEYDTCYQPPGTPSTKSQELDQVKDWRTIWAIFFL